MAWLRCLVAFVCLCSVSSTWGKKNDPNIVLHYVPQQAVGGSNPALTPAQQDAPARLTFSDSRQQADQIGQRTNDGDEMTTLLATTSVAEYVERTLGDIGRGWGVLTTDASDLVLAGRLTRFEVRETNQAVGATFKANVGLAFELSRNGAVLWRGTATGDATRYGKKFSNENCNEVLSDALLEAFAAITNDIDLAAAWTGDSPRNLALSPEQLLEEVKGLAQQSLSWETIVDFIGTKQLNRALTADDIAAWKAAGIPEDAIRAALKCPVTTAGRAATEP